MKLLKDHCSLSLAVACYRVVLCSLRRSCKDRKKHSTRFLPLFSLRGAEQPSLRCVYLFGAYVCARSLSAVARVTCWHTHAYTNAPLFMFMFISQTRCTCVQALLLIFKAFQRLNAIVTCHRILESFPHFCFLAVKLARV